jgi:uncharacterized integral membrane protein
VAQRDSISTEKRKIPPSLIGAVILFLAVIIFIFQNTDRVTIHFLWFERSARVWVAILVTSAVAIAAGELFSMYLRHRKSD